MNALPTPPGLDMTNCNLWKPGYRFAHDNQTFEVVSVRHVAAGIFEAKYRRVMVGGLSNQVYKHTYCRKESS